jgi:hypothetical protein
MLLMSFFPTNPQQRNRDVIFLISIAAAISRAIPGFDEHGRPVVDSVNQANQSFAVKIKFDPGTDFNRVFNGGVFERRY